MNASKLVARCAASHRCKFLKEHLRRSRRVVLALGVLVAIMAIFQTGCQDEAILQVTAGSSTVTWQYAYGGEERDEAYSIRQTADGGYVVAGITWSFGAGGIDCYVVKLDSLGSKEWDRTLGGGYDDEAFCVRQTSDAGYVVAGWSERPSLSLYVVKLDTFGDVEWDYVDDTFFMATSVEEAVDGGYVAAGATRDGKVGIVKIGTSGDRAWRRTYASAFDASIQRTTDGGYVVAGVWGTDWRGATYVLKIDAVGDVTWEKIYAGKPSSRGDPFVQQTADGGYVIAGKMGFPGVPYVLRLDASGEILWQKSYPEADVSDFRSIQQTADDGYVAAGKTWTFSDEPGLGNNDFYVVRLSASGAVVWQKSYGGRWGYEAAYSIQQTSDGGYVVAGVTTSLGSGDEDFYVVKADPTGKVVMQQR